MVTPPLLHKKTKSRVQSQLESGSAHWPSKLFVWLVAACLLLSLTFLITLIFDVVDKGFPVLNERVSSFISIGLVNDTPTNSGIFGALRGTFWIGVFVVAFAFPIGIAAAVYLEEYAKDNRWTRFVALNIRNLAGVPSVVYGILGLAVFVSFLNGIIVDVAYNQKSTLIAGGLTLAVLSLPIVIITASEAIRAVPTPIRQAAYGLGATKWEVIKSHVLPYAAPGIFTGALLTLARALGETAPLILVGAQTGRFDSRAGFFDIGQFSQGFTALPILIKDTASKADDSWRSFTAAAIVVLLLLVFFFNIVAIILRNRFEGRRAG